MKMNIDMKDIPAISRQYECTKPLRIYWSGVNWKRKGGNVALDCCKELISRGYKIEFHITGMRQLSQEIYELSWVHNHGFLDKNNPDEYRQLIDIMSKQDLFLFPSRAECSSIALCEANAFALPCFVYDTGGTANYVENNTNGVMLPLSATGKDFADMIDNSIRNGRLAEMSVAARKKYEIDLNWKRWSDKIKHILENI